MGDNHTNGPTVVGSFSNWEFYSRRIGYLMDDDNRWPRPITPDEKAAAEVLRANGYQVPRPPGYEYPARCMLCGKEDPDETGKGLPSRIVQIRRISIDYWNSGEFRILMFRDHMRAVGGVCADGCTPEVAEETKQKRDVTFRQKMYERYMKAGDFKRAERFAPKT